MQITSHFRSEEFDCKDGTPYPENWISERLAPLCQALETIRITADSHPLVIHSGYRSPDYNRRVGGANHSMHVEGKAADFHIIGMDCRDLAKLVEELIHLKQIPEGGVGSYSGWVHYDQRGYKARWREER